MFIYPDYYKDFKCINKYCKHSCCIMWEIDIDEDTAERYKAIGFTEGIDFRSDPPCFILDENERCPHLDSEGLCRIIKRWGEETLPEICREHPRFYNVLPHGTEAGLGLCCEEAARLLLSHEGPISLVYEGEAEEEKDAAALKRDGYFELIKDRSRSIYERTEALLEAEGISLPPFEPKDTADFLLSLERLDEGWTEYLLLLKELREDAADSFHRYMKDKENEYENTLFYLLYRYYLKGETDAERKTYAAFAVCCLNLIMLLGAAQYAHKGSFGFEDRTELLRLFSSEIEYSEENTEKICRRITQDQDP